MSNGKLTRRGALKLGTAAAAGVAASPLLGRYASAQSAAPIKIGFQVHRTGIGAAYGRWYDRTTQAAVRRINDMGGINGRPVEIITVFKVTVFQHAGVNAGGPGALQPWRIGHVADDMVHVEFQASRIPCVDQGLQVAAAAGNQDGDFQQRCHQL